MKNKCPYCGKKISYGTKLIERTKGEHKCSSCKKPSNIIQNNKIWAVFAACAFVSLLIFLFYLAFSKMMHSAYLKDGSYAFFETVFFGSGKVFKWIFWELVPFIVLFFVAPIFSEYHSISRYVAQSGNIDLGTGYIPAVNKGGVAAVNNSSPSSHSGSTRIIPKMGNTIVGDDHVFEDISSTSKTNIGSTRNFSLNSEETDYRKINPEDYTKSASYSGSEPLKKVAKPAVKETYVQNPQPELYRARVLREQEELKRQQTLNTQEKETNHNFSANRKF